MWDEIQIQCSDAYEIAEAIINNEITLKQLKSVPAFAAKADLTEDAVWDLCQSRQEYQRYLDLYPNGSHRSEVEDAFWNVCNSKKEYQRYLDVYPNGQHKAEAEEGIKAAALQKEEQTWQVALQRNDMSGYLEYRNAYPQGSHADEVDDRVWAVAQLNGTYNEYLSYFPNGNHADEARIMLAEQAQEEEAWKVAVTIDTPESYNGYIESYPHGLHVLEANRRIADLMAGQKERIIQGLSEDRNSYPLNFVKNMMRITKEDLFGKIKDSRGNVQNDVLKSWDLIPQNLSMGKTPTSIPKGSTEVYFWGVPGSGKTCAMAAILSRARQMGCFAPRKGEGLGYMNALSTMFIAERDTPAVCLPPASDVDTTQYLPLTLNEKITGRNGKQIIKQHNLSVVEISGEIFECFSREVEGKPYKSTSHKETYEQLKKYLKSDDNPKYHFFILDSKPLKNSDQMNYLQNAALYFKEEGVFNSTTQGISLIVTKSDILSSDRNEWVRCAEEAAKTNFDSLVTQLKVIVGDPKEGGLGLSDGSLRVIPLSIGEVFFQSLCLFDPAPASVLVNLLIEYSKVAETDDWKKKTKWFFKK